MKKRVVALMLTAGMVFSCLTGCGQEGQQEVSKGTSTSEESSQTSENTQKETEKVEEVTTVTWAISGEPQEDDEKVIKEINKLLRERYNLELNLLAIPGGEFNDRMRMMITGQEDFDLCFTANWANNFYDNVNQGAFYSLNDLLESEAGAELMEVYPEGLYNVATIGGDIYALPNYQLIYNQGGIFVQKDLADKYGLKPETEIQDIVDLEWFMDKIRDNEKDHFVVRHNMSFTSSVSRSGIFYDTFGTVAAVDRADENYQVVNYMKTNYFYEQYKKLNSYYDAGYIRSDVATVVDDSAEYKANKYAMYVTTGKPGGDVDASNNMGEDYYQFIYGEPTLTPTAGTATMTAINVNSKNPEAALKLYSVMWTDKEIYNMLLFGLEGEHYKKVADNRVELIADSGYDRSGLGWMLGNQFNAWLLPGQDDTVWEETEAINRSAKQSPLAGFVFDSAPVESELAQISSVKTEFQNGYLYAEDYDKWYNDYVTKLDAAGADVVVAELQKQIDAWRAANGK